MSYIPKISRFFWVQDTSKYQLKKQAFEVFASMSFVIMFVAMKHKLYLVAVLGELLVCKYL